MTTQTPKINAEERKAAALGAFMFFIPHFMNTKTEFVTLFMRQNFALWIVSVISQILMQIFASIAFASQGAIMAASETRKGGLLVGFMNVVIVFITLVTLVATIMAIFLIYKAWKGEKYEFKFLTKYTDMLIEKVDFLKKFFTPSK